MNVIAVRLMFLILRFNSRRSELRASVANVRANALIQSFVFGVAGFVVAFAVKPAPIATSPSTRGSRTASSSSRAS